MSLNGTLRKNFIISFDIYRAIDGLNVIVGCQNDSGWEILYDSTGDSDYKRWETHLVMVQSDNCTNFFILGVNGMSNAGAIGVDNIQFGYNCSSGMSFETPQVM